jgi:hypothetical protein
MNIQNKILLLSNDNAAVYITNWRHRTFDPIADEVYLLLSLQSDLVCVVLTADFYYYFFFIIGRVGLSP